MAILVSSLLAGASTAIAAPQAPPGLPGIAVAPSGTTHITGRLAGSRLRAVVTTHIVAIGRPDIEPPAVSNTNCTYSRYPCSVVDRIDIFVDGQAIAVPRSVFADLADLNRGNFNLASGNRLMLTFDGGDASAGYKLDIAFIKERVLSRKRSVGEFPEDFETTTYVAAPPSPNQ